MNLRAMVRLAPALAGMVLLAGCPVIPHNVVVNDTGAEIRVQNPDKSIFAALSREITLKPGARWDMWAYTENAEVRAGNCAYTWPDLASDEAWQALRGAWATPEERLRGRLELRLQPDFSLRVFPVNDDGTVLEELSAPMLPAAPKVDCRNG
jgi:hypothetical protein